MVKTLLFLLFFSQNVLANSEAENFYLQIASETEKNGFSQTSKKLLSKINDNEFSEEKKWLYVFALAKSGKDRSIDTLKNLLDHKSWVVRESAIKSLAALQATSAIASIAKKLKDPALVVRTTAVQALEHLNARNSAEKLAETLSDPQNFHAGKPLWIYKYVLKTLSNFEAKDASYKLVEFLERVKTPTVQKEILSVLEKLNGISFENKPLTEQVFLWKRRTLSEKEF